MAAAVQCEFDIWNVQIFYKYFHDLDQQKYLDSVLKGHIQLVPSMLSTFLTNSPTFLLLLTTITASVFATTVLLGFEGQPVRYILSVCIVLIQVWSIQSMSQSWVLIVNPVQP